MPFFSSGSENNVVISSHLVDIVRNDSRFSDLKLEETSPGRYIIQSIKKDRLPELKEELRKFVSQSYLLDDLQLESFEVENEELLSNVEKNYRVKCHLYKLKLPGQIPEVIQINQFANICCVEQSDPEKIPLDALISVDSKPPKSKSGLDFIDGDQNEDYKIFENACWNLPMNHHITLCMPRITQKLKRYSWNFIFEKCVKIASKNAIFPHTIGINIPDEISEHLKEFIQGILWTVVNLPHNYERPIYVLLFVKNSRLQQDAFDILKNLKSELQVSLGAPSDYPEEGFTVDVVKGLITEQKVDAVVSNSSKDLNLSYGAISKALLEKAGPQLKMECSRRFPNGIVFQEIAITKGHNLPSKWVFHGALPVNDGYDNENITTFVENCLLNANERNFSSIAFPALGTGLSSYTPKDAAQQMASAIDKFKTKIRKSSLKEIRIVIYPQAQGMEDFFDLKNQFSKDKGAVQKRNAQSPFQNEQKLTFNIVDRNLNWIQIHYNSASREAFSNAIKELQKNLPESSIDQLNTSEQERSAPDRINMNAPSSSGSGRVIDWSSNSYPKLDYSGNVSPSEERSNRKGQEHTGYYETSSGRSERYTDETSNYPENFPPPEDRFNTKKHESSSFNSGNIRMTSSYKPERGNTEYSTSSSMREEHFSPSEDRFNRGKQKNEDSDCFQTKNGFIVKVYQGNLLTVEVEGIVNAANKWLSHGAGVAKVIVRAAGDIINQEGRQKLKGRTLNDGDVLSTSAGNLKQYKNIIHAVGPMYTSQKSNDYCADKIKDTVRNSLEEADQLGLRSIALPAISSAIFGVPLHICTKGYFLGVDEFSRRMSQNSPLKEVHFVDLNTSTVKAIRDYFAGKLNEVSMNEDSMNEDSMDIHKSGDYSRNRVYNEEHEDRFAKEEQKPRRYSGGFAEEDEDHDMEIESDYLDDGNSNESDDRKHPDGTMDIGEKSFSFLGDSSETTFYEIKYNIPQSSKEGRTMNGISRTAYLPYNDEGKTILKMLQLAFEGYLIFKENKFQCQVSFSDIPHKTNLVGNDQKDSCWNPQYLAEVKDCLAAKGITSEHVAGREVKNNITLDQNKSTHL